MIGTADIVQRKRIEALEEAACEATRFIEAADAAIADLKEKNATDRSNAFASAKRASMDLTRSLASMRGLRWGD
ncbi:hypothetical protein CMI47_05360 [Candidatus Pacearchaeota archaeon]|jgi:hypothetical protein|nr:hypothetical protein [Candidatus Pacearchaeota archaeon]|tara:strand:+ start:268 stop:489 length:222 start_codon:yes stop_codon:yes gene_type:complete